jgi:hypothetical protein
MKKYITKDKYEGLDPEIAGLLKQGKIIKVKGWIEKDNISVGFLYDYLAGEPFPYWILLKCGSYLSFNNIEPILEDEPDWENLPVDTLLEVSDNEDFSKSKLRYFLSKENYIGAKIKCVTEGKTSKTMFSDDDWNSWKYARLVKE